MHVSVLGVRDSSRFICNQEWHRDGKFAAFNFLSNKVEGQTLCPEVSRERRQEIKATHNLIGDAHNIGYCLNSLRMKLKVLKYVMLFTK